MCRLTGRPGVRLNAGAVSSTVALRKRTGKRRTNVARQSNGATDEGMDVSRRVALWQGIPEIREMHWRCHYMFVRFRQQASNRLSVSIVHSQRVGGRLKHDHIAALGPVEMPPSVADRITFWQRVNERLTKLSNRIDATAQAKIRGAIHQRIPMPTTDGQRALQRENFEAEERLWDGMHSMHADNVERLKTLAATIEKQIADGQTAMAKTAEARDAAKEKRARLDSGERRPWRTWQARDRRGLDQGTRFESNRCPPFATVG
jgi:hypothetical protein